jgi:NADPH:quinone reductase-like Zn-dependent oxidoreductase
MSAAVMRMKAVIRSAYGDTDVLRIARLERPVPKSNEVLIRVKAAGLDRGQWHLMAGKPYVDAPRHGPDPEPRQRVRGLDVSGEVAAVGAGVTRFRGRRRGVRRGVGHLRRVHLRPRRPALSPSPGA